MQDQIDHHLVEVRFKPNSKMLDFRGAWAEGISSIMNLSHWSIDSNRIDLNDVNSDHSAFISFKNAGFVVRNANTRNYFADQSTKFFKVLYSFEGFDDQPYIERIGVRLRVCTKFHGSFKELVERYSNKFILISEPAKDVLQCNLIDIGSPLILSDKNGNINLMGGPMSTNQISHFFSGGSYVLHDIPPVGLTFDIDYWLSPNSPMSEIEIVGLVKKFSSACWSMNDRLVKLVLGD